MYTITVLPGDGVGPEITAPAVDILKTAANLFGFSLDIRKALIGGAAIDATGVPLPGETVRLCRASDAVLLGAVGGPKWDTFDGVRPEQGLLQIRKQLGLFANLRPATVYPVLQNASPLKPEILAGGLDILVVRELTGGIYFGDRGRKEQDGQVCAWDVEQYTQAEIHRIAHVAFRLAQSRKKQLCSVDKANVMESSRLWREEVTQIAAEYPDVTLSHMYVDNAAMQLVRAPGQFDVILTSNMFGDILSDEASQITGSIGMLPSASMGGGRFGLYEPIHGSAPDIAGQDIANPVATILSASMLLRHSCGQPQAADAIERAVEQVLNEGIFTADISTAGTRAAGTREMGERVLQKIRNPAASCRA